MANNIAYTGSDKWKQKATELLNQGGGGGGLVDDVKVNGTSVVDENKVAQIDLSDYATQSYVINALDDYTTTAVLQANYYNKSEVNSHLSNKADANSVYTKTEADTLLSAKANASDVYTKLETYSDDEVDALLEDKQDTLTASGNIEIDNNVIKRKEVWLNSVAEYEALANPDSNTDYHVPSVTFGLLPITVVNGKICCHYTKEVT